MGEMSRTLLVLCCCAAHVALSSASPRPPSLAELEMSGTVAGGMSVDEDLARSNAASDLESALRQQGCDTETMETPGQISTPGYPTPLQDETRFTKRIVAPEGSRVKLTMEDFHVYPRSVGDCLDYVTIYFSGDLELDHLKACDTEISPGTEFFSSGNTLLVKYVNTGFLFRDSTYRGFLASVSFVLSDINATRGSALNVHGLTGGCSLLSTDTEGVHHFQSPDYPEAYDWFAACDGSISTSKPSFLRVTALEAKFGYRDSLDVKWEFNSQSYSFLESGVTQLVPTSNVLLDFNAGLLTWGKFNLQIEVLTTDCHKIIFPDEGEKGELRLPSTYPADTFCEWWLVATEGKKIQLEIPEEFYVGTDMPMSSCTQDYLVVQPDGDPRYAEGGEVLCGSNMPRTFPSLRNKMAVKFDGLNGGKNDLLAYYSLE